MATSFRDRDVETCPPSRPGFANLGEDPKFSAAWPVAAQNALRYLRRRGVSYEQAEDIVQDVAERIARRDIPYTDAGDLSRFVVHVAKGILIDRRRSERRRATEPAADLDTATTDIADHIIESLTARRALSLLSPSDRDVLLSSIAPTYDRRYRARQRLLFILASLESWLLWTLRTLRRSRPRPEVVAVSMALIALTFAIQIADHLPETPSEHVPTAVPAARVIDSATTQPSTDGTPEPTDSTPASPVSYDELISLPSGRIVVGPGGGLAEAETEPTKEGDALICLGGKRLIPETCIGSATNPLGLP